MKTRISLFIVFGITVFLPVCNAPTANSQSFVRVVERAKPAIGAVRTYDAIGRLNKTIFGRSGGSGVIIKYKGKRYVLTNYHVIAHEEADFIIATFPDGPNNFRSFGVTVVGYDRLSDLAVLEIDPEKGPPLSEIEWGDSDTVQIGEWAITIGYPYLFQQEGSQHGSVAWVTDTSEFLYELTVELFQPTVSVGIISATDKIYLSKIGNQEHLHTNLIQTDAAINPGNSGGALVNREGQLIGINTFFQSQSGGSDGVGFAISANTAKNICERLIDFGYVRPVFLGLETEPITYESHKKLQLPHTNGIRVSSVTVLSPASEAKIKEGDVITALSGQPIKNERHFKALARLLPINQEVNCDLIRGGKHKNVKLYPGILGTITSDWGIVEQPDRKTLENYTHRGVIVTKVISDSLLGKEGLELGDLIYKINDREIHSLEDFKIFLDRLPRRKTIAMRYHIERRIEQHNWYRVIDFNTTTE